MKTIGLVDHTETYVPHAGVLSLIAQALERQAAYHYHDVWGVGGHVVVGTDAEELIHLFDDPESAGYLGWHDVDEAGNPYAHVYAKPSFTHGSNWVSGRYPISQTISHELLEMLGDPFCNVYGYDSTTDELWCQEMSDAVENQPYVINVAGGSVPVSNFVTPEFFNSHKRTGHRWDYRRQLQAPFSLLPGGYSIVAKLSGETELTARTQVRFDSQMPTWQVAEKLSPGSRTSWRRLLAP